MPHTFLADKKIVKAVAPTAGSPGTMTATVVDANGFTRAFYALNVGAITNTGTVDAYVQESATSGGSYANTTSAALTQIADTGGGKVYTIDCPVNAAKPFQKLIVVVGTAAAVNGATCILYRGSRTNPPTQTTGESVTV